MLGIYKASNRGRHSILNTNAKLQIKIPVRTLDDLTRESGENINSWSLVKIDVEGYEGFVIEGARESLPRIETLVMEFSPALQKGEGVDPALTLRALRPHFSRLYRIDKSGLVKISADDCLGSENLMELILER